MPWLNQTDFDRWLDGQHTDSYTKLGAHPNAHGTWFAVWAPYAEQVSVVGDFNGWDPARHPMKKVGTGYSGLWEVYVRGTRPGHHYKYRLQRGHYASDKADPYAFALEAPLIDGNPVAGLSSIVTDLAYDWGDQEWMQRRQGPASLKAPVSIYEVHLGSWRKRPDGYSLSYRDIAEPLADHVERMGFTHVELMPVMEHPYYASWGYQVVGYFAPTYRYGSPQDLMYLIDYLHQRGIGVLLDWVPAHFATDPQGLVFFDGSTLYEYNDPRMRYHPDWGTFVFDYNKPGVRNFLVSNACFWLDRYHVDGLRFDAVASMLYRDYSREDWSPNFYGGRENLEAISLLKQTNEAVYLNYPDVMMIAEESTAWPKVSQPTYAGGLGFLYKWNMGWMHDTLRYMEEDPIHRKYHHNDLTFPLIYAYAEHYMLPLSHDEVVHGKGSLWGKMPGDPWQKAANLRLLLGHQYGHPSGRRRRRADRPTGRGRARPPP
jgi:1,4-alpha-glucan branching enzyme